MKFIDPTTMKDVTKHIDGKMKELYYRAINETENSITTTPQSHYNVRTTAITKSGKIVNGGNNEMGITDSISHGEESVMVIARQSYPDDPIIGIAFQEPDEIVVSSSCGNCRDAIREYCSPETVILSGKPEGNVISIFPAEKMFFDDYKEVDFDDVNHKGFNQAFNALNRSYDVYVNDDMKDKLYGVALVTKGGFLRKNVFSGSFFGDVSYHPVTPISAAIVNWRDSSDDPKRIKIERLAVIGKGKPDVLYKDRQHLFEITGSLETYMKEEEIIGKNEKYSIPVYLMSIDEKGNPENIWKTNSREWLPYRFSALDLGMENELTNGIKKMLR